MLTLKYCMLFELQFFVPLKNPQCIFYLLWITYFLIWYICSLFFVQQPLLPWLPRGTFVPHTCAQSQTAVPIVSTNQMPSLKMKSKVSVSCLTERTDLLHVCPKSKIISKNPCSKIMISAQTVEIDTTIQNFLDGKHTKQQLEIS